MSLIFSGCSLKDQSDLGDGYFFLNEYDAYDYGYPGGPVIYKSDNFHHLTNIKIEGDVIKVVHNERFIHAIQRDTSNGRSHWFFILDKKRDLKYGPFDHIQYDSARIKLCANCDLKVKNEVMKD